MLKYTHKSGGKVSKKMKLRRHVVGHFSSRPELTIIVMALGISSFEKTEMTHGWQVAMSHMVKSQLNPLKIQMEWGLEM